ncbi:MAG: hypothetical protein ACUVQ6_03025 [Dissulfurimicrobium sp.]|uniref:hypothetical protein n=1 Tax=Dissulfurimicrobium sp. TaxID=2022436 RepID=UPI00404A9563
MTRIKHDGQRLFTRAIYGAAIRYEDFSRNTILFEVIKNGKIYWPGSHNHKIKMKEMLNSIRSVCQ